MWGSPCPLFIGSLGEGEITMTIDKLIERQQNRTDCFRYLSASFYQPDKRLFEEESFFENFKQAISKVFPEALLYAEQMEESFDECEEEELLVDYSALFIGPFELKAPPYCSVYLDAEKRLMGNFTIRIINFYKRAGIEISEDTGDVPDHIKVMLEFIYYLIYRQIEALKGGDLKGAIEFFEKEKKFFYTFLAPWIDQFCENIKNNAETKYYLGIAGCLLQVLKDNVSFVDDALNCINSL